MEHKHFRYGLPRFRPFRKLRIFWMGIRYALANDFSVGTMLLLSCLTVAVCFFIRQWLDVPVIFVTGLILSAELFSTAMEEPSSWRVPPLGAHQRLSAAEFSASLEQEGSLLNAASTG